MATLAQVAAYAESLPGTVVGARWNRRTWFVGTKGFLWERPLTKADIKRYGDRELPQGDLLGVMVESLDAKDALLAMAPAGFFTIEHFNGYPAVLVELRLARLADVKQAVLDAWRLLATPELLAAHDASRSKTTRRTAKARGSRKLT